MASLPLLMTIDPAAAADSCRLGALSQNGSLMKWLSGLEVYWKARGFRPVSSGDSMRPLSVIVQDRCDALVVFSDAVMYEVSDRIARSAEAARTC
jgi:hypothetical protein